LSFKGLTFVGGGRWATIVLKELLKVAPNLLIDWVCYSKLDERRDCLKNSQFIENLSLVDKKKYNKNNNKKVIISSHSSQHCRDFFAYVDVDTQTLIEKPLFSSIEDFESILRQGYKNTFINLEFYYAHFIREFYQEIESTSLKKIEFIWHDPLYEKRHMEETKYSEIYSSIFLDQLLHVMSICKAFNLNPENFKNVSINNYNPPNYDSLNIDFLSDDTHISVSLSRFSATRERKIIVNNYEAELNFSDKPNFYKNKEFVRELPVSDGLFPIGETLKNFLNFPNSIEMFNLSIESLLPFLRFCYKCEEKFSQSLVKEISLLSKDNINSKKFEPLLAYHAGIIYYQQLLELNPSCNIHFIRGDEGVSRLKDWWLAFIKPKIYKI